MIDYLFLKNLIEAGLTDLETGIFVDEQTVAWANS
jgi:predicted transcriptional regulator